MPPWWCCGVIVVGWCSVWLARIDPFRTTSAPPRMTFELADEVSIASARWQLTDATGKTLGIAETRTEYLKDQTFASLTRWTNLTFQVGPIAVQLPNLTLKRIVERDGRLRSMEGTGTIRLDAAGSPLELSARLRGEVSNGLFHGKVRVPNENGTPETDLDPIPLSNVLGGSPFEPLQRLSGLEFGKTWDATEWDPVSEIAYAAARQSLARIPSRILIPLPGAPKPKTYQAHVLAEPATVTLGPRQYLSYVIEYRSEGAPVYVRVDIKSGQVLEIETMGLGQRLTMQRTEPYP